MDQGLRIVCFFLGVCFLYSSALVLFTRGFLLTRVSVNRSSHCLRTPKGFSTDEHDGTRGCWLPPVFSKAVIILIDGLRYDFVRWNEMKTIRPFENKFTVVRDLLEEEPGRSYLAKFVADSPTTTMQRIKGLTTGGLPTFIDVGKNFGADEITEDNFINQLTNVGKRIVFMGDDTWKSLFPKSFFKAFPFPSFNVNDLDSVDDGILNILEPELRTKNWDVLIAHFLGVDHCGHRFGPHHPTMAQKLTQMNLMLRSVVENIGNDTVLFVMGDHGMTENGDHGGDSEQEVGSVLFAFSPRQLHNQPKIDDNFIKQIDFVPTISLLLGVPVPFGNLGRIIKELFLGIQQKETREETSSYELYKRALILNVLQVNEYLEEYNSKGNHLPSGSWHKVQSLFQDIKSKFRKVLSNISNNEDSQLQAECQEYLEEVFMMCQKVWAKFDSTLMILGIGLLLGILILNGTFLRCLNTNYLSWKSCCFLFILSLSLFITTALVHYHQEKLTYLYVLMCVIVIFLLVWTKKLISAVGRKRWQMPETENSISLIVAFFYFISFFSNSFLINEAYLLNYFIQGLLWSTLVSCIISNGLSRSLTEDFKIEKNKSITSKKKVVLCCHLILISAATRLSLNFLKCREEQIWCQPSLASVSPAKISEITIDQIYHLCVIACHISIPLLLLWWLKKAGNLNGHSLNVTSTKYLLVLGSVCTSYYWTIQLLPQKLLDKLPPWHQLWIPRLSSICYCFVGFCCVYSPLFIYVLPKQSSLRGIHPGSFGSVSNFYFHLKNNWQKHFSSPSASIPMVYGLASVYSANVLITTFTFALLSMMLLESKMALAFALLLASAVAALNVSALKKNCCLNSYPNPCWSDVVLWGFLSSFFFYATGHQPVISAIPWNAAFVGSDGEFASLYVLAIKILINLFCAFIVFSLALPLLFFWSFSFQLLFMKSEDDAMDEGEFLMFKKSDDMFSTLLQLFLHYTLYYGVKVLAIVCAAALHRRHLMVWKIFAPRYIFESVAFLLILITLFVSSVFILQIHAHLKKWIVTLEKEHSKDS